MSVWLTFSCLLVSSLECVLFPHRPCLSCSLFFSPSRLVSAFPPLPMSVLLTFSRLLVSSECVLYPYRPCLSCSLFLAFSYLV
ncbi:hypothetical protein K438DRAFT_1877303, partial [Mycena galopus ATCC 62051]